MKVTKSKYDGMGLSQEQISELEAREHKATMRNKLSSLCATAINKLRDFPEEESKWSDLVSAVNKYAEVSGTPYRLSYADDRQTKKGK